MPRYSYSTNQETYQGDFDTVEQACDEAAGEVGLHAHFWVGEQSKPEPESWWNAEDWLEHVSWQEEFSSEWADGWDKSTYEQRKELESLVRPIMAAWLDRHKLRPKFFNIEKPRKFYVAGKSSESIYEIEAV